MQRSRVEAQVIGSLAGFRSFAGDRPARAKVKMKVGWAGRVSVGLGLHFGLKRLGRGNRRVLG